MNHLIIWKDFKLFLGKHQRSISRHSHPVVQLVLGVDNTFLSKNNEGKWESKQGVLFAPNYVHECDATNVSILSIEIDPDSLLGEWVLEQQLCNKLVADYPSDNLRKVDFKKIVGAINSDDWSNVRKTIEDIFYFVKIKSEKKQDKRIKQLEEYISRNIHKNISTQDLMDIVNLSESRLIHLFKEIKGLPIRNYILWCRIQIVMESILAGSSLTSAAFEAGFSDQAHMTRTFTKMVGVPPSSIIKNSKLVKISFPC